MFETLIDLDKSLLVYLNTLGAETYDSYWLFITKQLNWLPFFLFVLFLLLKKLSLKKIGVILILISLLILCTDQLTNLSKRIFQRARPCNTEDIRDIIRIVKSSNAFSFFSGHASNSMATMVFLYFILRRYYKYAFLIFLFPLIFAYSRIYLSLHFPLDILVGFGVGITMGSVFYFLYKKIEKKYLEPKK